MKKMFLLCCSLALMAALQAQIIHVPAAYPTIQQGINAAKPGDTVLVAEGTYYEQINFKGKKPLVVASRFIKDGDTSHIRKTIINGSQITKTDSASVVYFVSGEDTTSILCGFTIRGGKGTLWKSPDMKAWDMEGGGIYVDNGSCTIRNNIITANSLNDQNVTGSSGVFGGGIMIEYYEGTKYPWCIIENNEISYNSVITSNIGCGAGGIWAYGNIRIKNNLIKGNTCTQTSTDPAVYLFGGGLGYGSPANPPKELKLQDNIFESNSVIGIDGCGAGACMDYGKITCTGNTFSGNKIVNSNAYGGGGILCEWATQGSVFSNNIFRNNKSAELGGGISFNENYNASGILIENNYFFDNVAAKGGAIGTNNVPLKLHNNVFSGNHAIQGGALYLDKKSDIVAHYAKLFNNSFSNNSAQTSGGAIYSLNARPLIINSVFWGDSAGNGREIYTNNAFSPLIEIVNSVFNPAFIQGTIVDGGGNLNQDPMFADPVMLTISALSNCLLDKGTSSYTCKCGTAHNCPNHDIRGVSRLNGAAFDIGAYEYSGVGIDDLPPAISDFGIVNYPNPFSGSTTFSYKLIESTLVSLKIFNNLGLLVAEPVNEFQQNGEHKVIWNAEGLPAGIYYCRLQAGKQVKSVKVLKMK